MHRRINCLTHLSQYRDRILIGQDTQSTVHQRFIWNDIPSTPCMHADHTHDLLQAVCA